MSSSSVASCGRADDEIDQFVEGLRPAIRLGAALIRVLRPCPGRDIHRRGVKMARARLRRESASGRGSADLARDAARLTRGKAAWLTTRFRAEFWG